MTAANTVPVQVKLDEIPFANSGMDAPTIYADVIRGTSVMGEVTKINLVEHRADPLDDQIKAVKVATIVVPTSQLRAWGQYFISVADQVGIPQMEVGDA